LIGAGTVNRRKRRSQLDTIDEINMTPLMDLTFLLLIIFMIATPLMEYSIDVSPPEMNADTIEDKKSETVNLLANGQINFRGQIVSRDSLFGILKNLNLNVLEFLASNLFSTKKIFSRLMLIALQKNYLKLL